MVFEYLAGKKRSPSLQKQETQGMRSGGLWTPALFSLQSQTRTRLPQAKLLGYPHRETQSQKDRQHTASLNHHWVYSNDRRFLQPVLVLWGLLIVRRIHTSHLGCLRGRWLWFTCSRWWTQSTPQFWRLHCFMTSTLLWFLDWIFIYCRERNKKQNGLEFCFSPKQLGSYFSDLVCCTFIPLLLIMLRLEDTAFLKVEVK